ncbi:MAG TPA: 2-oxoglutarate dehydrogenase complex dihydrolipoyllysine-residue succinyltransferase [Lacipirellulaceae bacterium]|jgi:2-oxoglutarate dehydrogenase E2 component (dihydrolipoamide succinyltransferase)|nr:2-oxoglutarate dehydrogenase complex dihydrolipoyllysine-residue succinyltransferase [Lacipirellulaceae bacterium]
MSIELKIPEVGESVHEVQIGRWLKREGDAVALDENVVELETDKASMELPAPAAGVLGRILKREGEMVVVGDVIGYLENGDAGKAKKPEPTAAPKSQPGPAPTAPPTKSEEKPAAPVAEQVAVKAEPAPVAEKSKSDKHNGDVAVTPAARRALREFGLKATDIDSKGDSLRRKDVLRYVESQKEQKLAVTTPTIDSVKPRPVVADASAPAFEVPQPAKDLEEIVPMSLIRRRIAARLVSAQQTAALLTTFNEIDMTAVKELRNTYRDSFQTKYGVKLGFMPFFVKAVIDALKETPALNAEIREDKIVYRRYYNIGMAVSSTKGLVVPVLRNAAQLSFAGIEQAINEFSQRAGENKLDPKDFENGTFTISNGGVFGSLLSTPIVNPPQSGVLGLHAIQDRPIAYKGQVVIRPMMYVALTYDHRLVDGREAVTFLRRVKETIEDPSRMLLEV